MHGVVTAEEYLEQAIAATSGDGDCRAALDQLPVPVYVTDAEGVVTCFNSAGAAFVGRDPQPGRDRWCISWQLYSTSGDPMPHDQCPMAEAIHKKQPIRGKVAIAMRPDGRRAAFRAYPTPLISADGELTGAVNLLVDVTDEQAKALAEQADRCRRLSQATHDPKAARMLDQMAIDYARTAATLRADTASPTMTARMPPIS